MVKEQNKQCLKKCYNFKVIFSAGIDNHISPGMHGAGHASWQLLFMDSLVFSASSIAACK